MFAILADSRTGTHLLRSLLNSHPKLTCFDEILGLRKAEKDFYTLGANQGCLISYANLVAGNEFAEGNDIPRILDILRKVPVIHLTRDLTERARSQLYYAQLTAELGDKSPFRKANLEVDIHFVPQEGEDDEAAVAKIETMFRERQEACLAALAPIPGHWMEISYEWLCGEAQLKTLAEEKARALCDYLQVPIATLTTNLYKIR